jgi:hypothetical protein
MTGTSINLRLTPSVMKPVSNSPVAAISEVASRSFSGPPGVQYHHIATLPGQEENSNSLPHDNSHPRGESVEGPLWTRSSDLRIAAGCKEIAVNG